MVKRKVVVTLEAAGVADQSAPGVLREFTPADRIRRAAMVMGVSLLMAAALIPIPIIHLLGIPMVLVAGLVVAGRQLASVARLEPVRVACPKCGVQNRVGGGLGLRSPTAVMERTCEACRRTLTMQLRDR